MTWYVSVFNAPKKLDLLLFSWLTGRIRALLLTES
ncbi:MAG: Uncharacterised protein [Prochlorococcus marinus str. MIT 9215]|nr:MAG: Uncharacterised protein [Prochlorococcus marinus str. MIT 9215]